MPKLPTTKGTITKKTSISSANKRTRYESEDDHSASEDNMEENTPYEADARKGHSGSDSDESVPKTKSNRPAKRAKTSVHTSIHANEFIPKLKPFTGSIVKINEDEMEKLSGLYLSGIFRRRSSVFSELPTDMAFIRQIDDCARALLPTFVYTYFFLTPPEAFKLLYKVLVDDDTDPRSGTLQKALSQKAFFEWKDWTTEPKNRGVKRFSRVLTCAYR
jgi:hypothetical protein